MHNVADGLKSAAEIGFKHLNDGATEAYDKVSHLKKNTIIR